MSVSMPEVDRERDFPTILAAARKLTSETPEHRQIALITPGRLVMMLPCPPAETVSQEMIASIREIVPEEQPQVITTIAFTDVVSRGPLEVAKVNQVIPFTGYLLGMAFVGHNVVVFEGHPSALAAGCLGADLLIVDGAMADQLQENWVVVAAGAMRKPRILVFGRDGRLVVVDPSTEHWVKSERKKPWWRPF